LHGSSWQRKQDDGTGENNVAIAIKACMTLSNASVLALMKLRSHMEAQAELHGM
jgi:hypothetical protein